MLHVFANCLLQTSHACETDTKVVWTYFKIFYSAQTILHGKKQGKKTINVDNIRRGGTIILRSGQGWTLLAQIGQLKTGLG